MRRCPKGGGKGVWPQAVTTTNYHLYSDLQGASEQLKVCLSPTEDLQGEIWTVSWIPTLPWNVLPLLYFTSKHATLGNPRATCWRYSACGAGELLAELGVLQFNWKYAGDRRGTTESLGGGEQKGKAYKSHVTHSTSVSLLLG